MHGAMNVKYIDCCYQNGMKYDYIQGAESVSRK